MTAVEAWDGVGLVGRTGVGVPLPVACAGVGLVGLMLLGVVLGSPVGSVAVSPFAVASVGRGASGLGGTLSPSVEEHER